MWKLRIGEKNGNLTTVLDGNGDEYLFSTNNFVGRQIWEFDPDAGTQEEREEVERLREQFLINKKMLDIHCCGDLLMRTQVSHCSPSVFLAKYTTSFMTLSMTID